jgi:hypothetical protein
MQQVEFSSPLIHASRKNIRMTELLKVEEANANYRSGTNVARRGIKAADYYRSGIGIPRKFSARCAEHKAI